MCFGKRSIGWIKRCINIMSYLVLINSSPTSFFRSSRGLRWGDLASPYLFVKSLSYIINKALWGGFMSGWRVRGSGKEGEEISHLLFTDNTLIFCDSNEEQLICLC